MKLAVKLPKFVVIQNTRLAICEIFLQICVCAGLVVMISYKKTYLARHKPIVNPNVFGVPNSAEVALAKNVDLEKDFCVKAASGIYDYEYSENFKFGDFECVIDEDDTFLKGGIDSIFVPTSFREDWIEKASGNTGCDDLVITCGAQEGTCTTKMADRSYTYNCFLDNRNALIADNEWTWKTITARANLTNETSSNYTNVTDDGNATDTATSDSAATSRNSTNDTLRQLSSFADIAYGDLEDDRTVDQIKVVSIDASGNDQGDHVQKPQFTRPERRPIVRRKLTLEDKRRLAGVYVPVPVDVSKATSEHENKIVTDHLRKCRCETRGQYFMTGVERQKVAFQHSFQLEYQSEILEGSSMFTINQANTNGKLPVLSIILSFQNGAMQEHDCNRPVPGQCRFSPGEDIQMQIEEFLDMARVDLDGWNDLVRENQVQKDESGYSITPDPDNPDRTMASLRVTGVEINVELQYRNEYLHNIESWDYTVCFVKIKSNKSQLTAFTAEQHVVPRNARFYDEKRRRRDYTGIRFVFTPSEDSEFGFIDYLTFINQLAVFVVYFGVIGNVVLVIAVFCLGNTSRNYKRAQSETLDVMESSCKGLPSRMIQSAVAFFMLAALERLGERAEEIVPGFHVPGTKEEHSQMAAAKAARRRQRKLRNCAVSRKTVEQVLSSIFAFNDEIDQAELKDLTSSVYHRLSKSKESVRLCDFLDATTSNEHVDFESAVAQFDQDRKKGCLEKVFDDTTDNLTDGEAADVDMEECCCLVWCCQRRGSNVSPDGEETGRNEKG